MSDPGSSPGSTAPLTRVYLPLSVADLRLLAESGHLPGPCQAYAVTDQARTADPDADEEELEYDALSEAAEVDLGQPRVVVAADIASPRVAVSPLSLDGPVSLERVVSVHVSEPGAAPDEELLWYDVSELPTLAASLRAS